MFQANFETSRTVIATEIPGTYDLRNVGGQNFVTPIKDQGNCGSCVAFGVLATVEGMTRTQSMDRGEGQTSSQRRLAGDQEEFRH
jgi:C1A family cysteine protease